LPSSLTFQSTSILLSVSEKDLEKRIEETVSFPENDPGQSQEVVLKIFPDGFVNANLITRDSRILTTPVILPRPPF